MKLFKVTLESGKSFDKIIYIVAKSYKSVEETVDDSSLLFNWNHGQRIADIEEIDNLVVLSKDFA